MECKSVIGLVLVIASILLILFCLLKKEASFFNLREVISQHFSLFKDTKSQYVVFYVLPLAFSIGLSLLYTANDEFYQQISVIVGVILSILLAVLSILTSKHYDVSLNEEQNESVKRVVKETINSISFATFVCVFIMMCSLVMIVIDNVPVPQWVSTVLSCGAFYCFTILILTMLMIVKRINRIIMFDLDIKEGKKNDAAGIEE